MIMMSLLSTNAVSHKNTRLRHLQNMALMHFYMTTFYLFYITIWRRMDAYTGLMGTAVGAFHIMVGVLFVYGRALFAKSKHIVTSPALVFSVMVFFPINVLSTMSRAELYGKYMLFTAVYFALMYGVVFLTDYESINGRSYLFCGTMWMLASDPFGSTLQALMYVFGVLVTLLCLVGFWHTHTNASMEPASEALTDI